MKERIYKTTNSQLFIQKDQLLIVDLKESAVLKTVVHQSLNIRNLPVQQGAAYRSPDIRSPQGPFSPTKLLCRCIMFLPGTYFCELTYA